MMYLYETEEIVEDCTRWAQWLSLQLGAWGLVGTFQAYTPKGSTFFHNCANLRQKQWIYGEEPSLHLYPTMVRPPSEVFPHSSTSSVCDADAPSFRNQFGFYAENIWNPAQNVVPPDADNDSIWNDPSAESDSDDSTSSGSVTSTSAISFTEDGENWQRIYG